MAAFLSLLVLGGCVGDRGDSDLSASTTTRHARDDGDGDSAKPRQVCEHTEIGGEAKSFCY